MFAIFAVLIVVLVVLTGVTPIFWTVRRILRPIDRAAKDRNAPLRFSIGDFLCLFWMVQLPLAFVFQLSGEETLTQYWLFTVVIWAVAPVVWFTCARALSKAGVSTGKHRFIFLAVVVPTVYYGLFPFIGLSWAGIATFATEGFAPLWQDKTAALWWLGLAIALALSGFYSPWIVRQPQYDFPDDEHDTHVINLRRPIETSIWQDSH
jgi:hypothetical protein